MTMPEDRERAVFTEDPARSGVHLTAPEPLSRGIAREESALTLLEEITSLLQSNEPEEGALLHEFVGILTDVGLTCALDVERGPSTRERYGAGTRETRLEGLIDRQVERAQREGRAVWCSRDLMAQPYGVRERVRDMHALADLGALDIDWMLSVPVGNDQRALGALTVYASSGVLGFPSVAFVKNVAQLVGIAIANRRQNAAMTFAVERRDVAMANVAHDMKNPLSIVLIMSRILKPLVDERPEALHSLETIERQTRYMVTLVRDILESAMSGPAHFALKPKATDAMVLVADALTSFEPLYEGKALSVSYTAEPSLPPVYVDPARIMQVLLNLVGNAIKFTPREGSISVRVERDGDAAAFSVIDSGPGLSPDQIACVFERFWQADTSGSGTGLGLTIVRDIVEAHGGTVRVESVVGSGAKFTFTVPFARTVRA